MKRVKIIMEKQAIFIHWFDKIDEWFKTEHGRDQALGSTERDTRVQDFFFEQQNATEDGLSVFGI